ncbi:MAG: exopolysaccharide biosynthesis protein [Rickettsiales bacterium]|nr:MAG: exopolysaccharide biosynthesis protein [Rickettsiales bacterium]
MLLKKKDNASTSDLLKNVKDRHINDDNINIGDLLKSLENGGFAFINMVCAIILMIPTPPPIAIVMGLAVMFFSWQMMVGYVSVWMPKYITSKSIPRHYLQIAIDKSLIYLSRVEKLTHRRFVFMFNENVNRISAFIMFICAAISLSPLLFANTIPGIAIVLICFGILNKDGLIIVIGYIVAIVGAAVAWYMVKYGAKMFFALIHKIFD